MGIIKIDFKWEKVSVKIDSSEKEWSNWSENVRHVYRHLVDIDTEQALSRVISENDSVRVIGSGFSSSDIVAGTNVLVDMSDYDKVVSIDRKTREITVQAGISLENLMIVVKACGWTISSLPDIDKITVGGALSTGTHGTSGYILSGYVSKFRMVMSDGQIREFKNTDLEAKAISLSLGLLGVISQVTFVCEDDYFLDLNHCSIKSIGLLNQLEHFRKNDFSRILFFPHIDRIFVLYGHRSTESLKEKENFLKNRKKQKKISNLLYKYRYTPLRNRVFYFSLFENQYRRILSGVVIESPFEKMELMEWGVSHEKFKFFFFDLIKLLKNQDYKKTIKYPIDIRFLKRDDIWMSPAFNEDMWMVSFIFKDFNEVKDYRIFWEIERLFLKYDGKPHLGKRTSIPCDDLKKCYPKWLDFENLRSRLDPMGKFLNPYLSKLFGK